MRVNLFEALEAASTVNVNGFEIDDFVYSGLSEICVMTSVDAHKAGWTVKNKPVEINSDGVCETVDESSNRLHIEFRVSHPLSFEDL